MHFVSFFAASLYRPTFARDLPSCRYSFCRKITLSKTGRVRLAVSIWMIPFSQSYGSLLALH